MKLFIQIHFNRNNFELSLNYSFDLKKATAIWGRSGHGKTTLLRIISGLEKNATGKIFFNDETWLDTRSKIFLPPEKRKIGYVFQNPLLFPHLNIEENLNFAKSRSFQNLISKEEIIHSFNIESLLKKRSHQISGGEAQRICLARTLLSGPRLILLDEPLSSLDEDSKNEILSYLKIIKNQFQIPLIYVSHSSEEILQISDMILIFNEGKIMEEKTLNQFKAIRKKITGL